MCRGAWGSYRQPRANAPVARRRQRTNPFYVLLVAIGILFTVTASAYFVLALRGNSRAADRARDKQDLMGFMDRQGVKLLSAELALLALATCGAIGTDSWWSGGNSRESDAGGHEHDERR